MIGLERRQIIADVQPMAASRALPAAVFAAVCVCGAAAAWYFARHGLTLSHHDARAHLTVARRITDNLTPGWQQVGALWLPLPHLLNALPVMFGWNYRTGFSAVVFSILSMAWGLSALARMVQRRTGSALAAWAGAALVLCNPNVLYLQSTPMTEPMLFGLSLVAIDAVDRWLGGEMGSGYPAVIVGLLVLVRYEAWPVALVLLIIGVLASTRGRGLVTLASVPLCAVAGFLLLSRASVGHWFVSSGFFVADNAALGRPLTALAEIIDGFRSVTDDVAIAAAVAGIAWCVRDAAARRSAQPLLPIALFATVILPLGAFHSGHPFRSRYMVPLAVGAAALAPLATAWLPPRLRGAVAVAMVAGSLWINPPLRASAPIVVEAQVESPLRLGRLRVTEALIARTDRSPILASMQSLGHYMQETSAAGLNIEDYLHEGNGDLWTLAVAEPRRSVHWILIEERAEGGDVLAHRAASDPRFLDGFVRVAEGGGLALYRLDEPVMVLDK